MGPAVVPLGERTHTPHARWNRGPAAFDGELGRVHEERA